MQDPHIQLTMEEPIQDGSLPFLDTKVSPGPNNTLITTVYRKPTHTDQYLHWDCNHFTGAKHSVYNTLAHRAKIVSHRQWTLKKELDHIREALQACHFPSWSLNKLQQKFEHKHQTNSEPSPMDIQPTNNNVSNNNNSNKNISIVVPYIHELGEKFKRTCKNKGIQVHFKGTNTVKTLLMASKDKNHILQKSGIIYRFKCLHIHCPEEYIGESGRTLGERVKEHLMAPSPIHQHCNTPGHPVSPGCFTIVHREPQGITRNIKEAMFIQVNDPTLNRNLGKYQLPYIWDHILQGTPALQLK